MWNLNFISEEDFTNHVKATIEKYGEKLESFDLKRFNKNIIDPIKLIFDKTVYQSSWDEIVSNEIFRQRDKSNNNDIGYFHQRIFQYIKNKKLNSAKYEIINEMELKLPLAPFTSEWDRLNNKYEYIRLTKIEKFIPWMFIFLYSISILYPIIKGLLMNICPCIGG